MSFDMVRE
jgi:hypothetical protein